MNAGARCAIATPHRLATEAGVEALRDGGNAIDAALAAAAALTVVYPHMCSIGGDIMALVALPHGGITAINGSGAAALACEPETLREHSPQMPLVGSASITVPGAVAAWESMSVLGGRLPLSSVIAPAITFAAEGVPIARSLDNAFRKFPKVVPAESIDAIFADGGVPLAEGRQLRQPALAESLQSIAADGASALYGGELGDRLIAGLRDLGSSLTLEDLERHATEISTPLAGQYGGVEVLTTRPNSQGFVLLEILAALAHLAEVPDPLGPHAALLAELCRMASLDRDRYLADPRFAEVPVGDLLSESHGAELLNRARTRLGTGRGVGTSFSVAKGDTVAVVTADSEGNAASVIQSIFHTFGSGILEPATGIIMHNRGASFDLDPNLPNALAPGKRPLHTLMPVMVRRGDRLIGVLGTMGGKAQPQIHLQLLLRTLRSESPESALVAPRWVVGGLDEGQAVDVVHVERSAGESVLEGLARTGLKLNILEDKDEDVGHGQMIVRDATGGLMAGTDPRADGSAAIISI